MIRVDQLTKKFNEVTAVDGISFEVEKEETLVLLGTSGCGKTTTLKMINRLVEPTAGEIFINGKNAKEQRVEALRRNIGYVIQSKGLFPHYTVAENVAVVPKLLKWQKSKIENRIAELLEMLHLPPVEYLHRYPHELSGGQQQRVSIARALAADPGVILMDEPFGALDPVTRNEIRNEFKSLEKLLQKTIVMVTHDVFEAVELGDKICLMDAGKVQQLGSPKELIFNPANAFVRKFLEGNQFELELMAVQLKDVLEFLAEPPTKSDHLITVSEEKDLLSTLDHISKADGEELQLRIENERGEMVKSTARDAVLSAFYQYKQKLRS